MSRERAEGDFRVRRAVPDDRAILQMILDGSFGGTGSRVHGLGVDDLLHQNRVYLAFVNERPMGCVMATLTDPMILHCMHVLPEHRRAGHAGAMLTTAIGHIDKTTPVEFWTAVDPARKSGVERCRSLGFLELAVDFTELSAALSGMCVMVRPAPPGRPHAPLMAARPASASGSGGPA